MQLDAAAFAVPQYVSNRQSAQTNLTLEESALSSSTTTLQSDPRPGGAGQHAALNDSPICSNIATQISAARRQLLGTANSQNANGEYLFAGYSVRHPAVRARSSGIGQLPG